MARGEPIEPALRRQSLDGDNVRSLDLRDRNQARVRQLAVDEHTARAALALAATFLCAGQPQVLAQRDEQPAHAGHLERLLGTIDCESVAHPSYGPRMGWGSVRS